MIAWLVPVSLFWTLAALYLGGADLRIEGGGGGRQLTGLGSSFVLFLVAWAALRGLAGLAGAGAYLAVVAATLVAVVALPYLTRLGFRVAGVRVTPHDGGPTPA